MHPLPRFAVTAVTTLAVAAVPVVAFAPAASAAAPPAASSVSYRAGDGRVALSWQNPTASADFAKVRLVYATDHAPATVDDGTAVPLSADKATSAVATGLANGQPYTFVLFTADAADAATASPAVTVTPHTPAQGRLTAALGRSAIGPGLGTSTSVLSGTYTDAAGEPVAGLRVRVMREFAGTSTWERVATVTSGPTGGFRMVASPTRAAYYRFQLPASAYDAATTSRTVKLDYVPAVSFAAPTLARTYTPFAVSGFVKPAKGNQPVVLRRYYSGAWHSVARTRTGTYGGYRFTIKPTSTSARTLRAVFLASPSHAAGVSPTRTVQVTPRDLRSGMTGPDVLALQRRLAGLHYDVGSVDGEFGFDTSHAVVAFQKLNGLPRTGVAGGSTLSRLASPAVPHRRHLVSGRSVEVDKTHQIAAFYSGGSLYRILDVSTGSEQAYWQDGQREIAHTPEGSFQVIRKIDGMRYGALGALYRPSYFYGGYAIHGNGSVPAYPASHGCVRITDPAADRYFDWLTIGTRVYVFH